MFSRRSIVKVLTGLVAAPAIVPITNLMPVKALEYVPETVVIPQRSVEVTISNEVNEYHYVDSDIYKQYLQYLPKHMQSFMQFQNTPYRHRMIGLRTPHDYIQQQIMEARTNPGHVMGPNTRKWYGSRAQGILGMTDNRQLTGLHDEDLRNKIRAAIHEHSKATKTS